MNNVLPWLEQTDFPLSLNLVFIANGFMLSGFLVARVFRYVERKGKAFEFVAGIIAVICMLIFSLLNKTAMLNSFGRVVMARSFFGNYIMFILSGMCGSCVIILFVNLLFSQQKVLGKMGAETLTILAVHIPIVALVEKIVSRIPYNSAWMILLVLVSAMTVLYLSYRISITLRKLIPNLVGIHQFICH